LPHVCRRCSSVPREPSSPDAALLTRQRQRSTRIDHLQYTAQMRVEGLNADKPGTNVATSHVRRTPPPRSPVRVSFCAPSMMGIGPLNWIGNINYRVLCILQIESWNS
jgi:hypothetical protein